MRLQAGARRAPALGLPGRHARRPRGRLVPGLGGGGLPRRAAHGAARRPVRARDGADLGGHRRRARAGRRLLAEEGAARLAARCCAPAATRGEPAVLVHADTPALRADGGVRRGGQQRRPQGRPRARGRRRPPLRRRPRPHPARRGQAAHGALGLGRAAAARRRRRGAGEAARRARRGVQRRARRAHHPPRGAHARRAGERPAQPTPASPSPPATGPRFPGPRSDPRRRLAA